MPCMTWVYDARTEKAHAIANGREQLVTTALCGRELTDFTPYKSGQEMCTSCTSRDEEIHRGADHTTSAPSPSRPQRQKVRR
jgi:hypothetical protein